VAYKDMWPNECQICHDLLESFLKRCVFYEYTLPGTTFRCYENGNLSITSYKGLKFVSGSIYLLGKEEIEYSTRRAVLNARKRGQGVPAEVLPLAKHYGISVE
jgi:hypothetical protein